MWPMRPATSMVPASPARAALAAKAAIVNFGTESPAWAAAFGLSEQEADHFARIWQLDLEAERLYFDDLL